MTLNADVNCQLKCHVFKDEIDRKLLKKIRLFFKMKVIINVYIVKSISKLDNKNQDGL